MKPDFQRVKTHWNQGFLAFRGSDGGDGRRGGLGERRRVRAAGCSGGATAGTGGGAGSQPRSVSRFLVAGYGGLVPFEAVTGYGGRVQQAVTHLEGARQYRVGPVLPLQPVRGRGDPEQVRGDLG